MAAPNRQSAYNVSVFALNSQDLLGLLENVTVKRTIKHEDASGISDLDAYAWGTKRDWDADADLFYADGSGIMAAVGTSVTVALTMAGSNYLGTALIDTGHHQAHRDTLQKMKITLKGQGALTSQGV